MKSTSVLSASAPPHENEGEIPLLYRWRFNLKTGAVQEEQLDDRPTEFPRINEQHLGQQTRYGYTAQIAAGTVPRFDALIKYDFETGNSQTHEFGSNRYGGEGVFVPRPGATAEDDGWLLTFVYDGAKDTSELVVVNAQDMTADPIARIVIPQRVPYGFHGTWITQN
jgi:carotenoid cleavage dioxygenase